MNALPAGWWDPVTISVRLTRADHSHIFYEWHLGAIEPLGPGELPHRVVPVPFGWLEANEGATQFYHSLARGFTDAAADGVAYAGADEEFAPVPRIPPGFLDVQPGNLLGSSENDVYSHPQVTMDRRPAWLTMTFTHTANPFEDFDVTHMSTNLNVHLHSILAVTPADQPADTAWNSYLYNMELLALLASAMIQDDRSLTAINGPISLGGDVEAEWDLLDEGPAPASQAALDALPTRQIAEDEQTERCVVCLEDMGAGQRVAVLPCTHVFHEQCVKQWLGVCGTCPICRGVVEDGGEEV